MSNYHTSVTLICRTHPRFCIDGFVRIYHPSSLHKSSHSQGNSLYHCSMYTKSRQPCDNSTLSYLMPIPTYACAFKIASNPQLSQQSLCLIRQLTHIEHVDLFESRGVTDEVMVALAQCAQLKVLKIDACRRISDTGT